MDTEKDSLVKGGGMSGFFSCIEVLYGIILVKDLTKYESIINDIKTQGNLGLYKVVE